MLNTYLAIVSHPLFFTFIALCGGVYALLWATSLKPSALPQPLVWLRRHYVSALLIVVGILFVLAMTFYLVEIGLSVRRLVDLLGNELAKAEPQAEALRFLAHSIGILVAILAGSATIFFASIRVWTNERNTTATEQGLITDRINKAVEGLGAEKTVKQQRQGSEGALLYEDDINGNPDLKKPIMAEVTKPNIEVRTGSILALERLAKENLDFHIQIIEILCAYVRNNAMCDDPSPTGKLERVPSLRDDIQMAIKAIGRRGQKGKQAEAFLRFRLDLRNCNLSGADFATRDYSGAMFHHSLIEGANFMRANFQGAELNYCTLNYSRFLDCDLTGAILVHATLNQPVGSLHSNHLGWATLRGLDVSGADLSGVFNLGDNIQMNTIFGTSDTKLHERYTRPNRNGSISELRMELEYAKDDGESERADDLSRKLSEKGFRSWSPYSSDDGVTHSLYNDLMIKLDLCHFPFHGRHK
ncbi:pentapeptide repeat-containing protein [Phaeobacter porticola]|uniref:Putative low-complexity protein n=1 Tax=Phaeobacter porticola TaxID=1844006 RepID=A0A1L3I5E8_9RHOB|nr:pentapeptide repeat-containing protein [Phaeobacter porticola]APG47339.1 putative low-complexity protein [Phaeobacter porticola]